MVFFATMTANAVKITKRRGFYLEKLEEVDLCIFAFNNITSVVLANKHKI